MLYLGMIFLSRSLLALNLLGAGRRSRIDYRSAQDFSRRIHHGQLAACTEGRIPAKYHFSRDRRLHEELVQVLAEYFDRPVLRLFRQLAPDLTLDSRRDQTMIAVRRRLLQDRCGIGIIRRMTFRSRQPIISSSPARLLPILRQSLVNVHLICSSLLFSFPVTVRTPLMDRKLLYHDCI